ncbi:MAG: cryptochrome/photolyase family protein [Parvibaculales bacterium]
MSQPIIVWFRQDLRLDDNPALAYACSSRKPIIPLFIDCPDERALGSTSLWWRGKSLASLADSLYQRGAQLILAKGPPAEIIDRVIQETGADTICWNRQYEPHGVERDTGLKSRLKEKGLVVESFNANLLFEPWEIKNKSGGPFKVFTPFWRHCLARTQEKPLAEPIDPPKTLTGYKASLGSLPLDHFQHDLPPQANQTSELFHPGEGGAWAKLNTFTSRGLGDYADGRDFAALESTSRLSPHLRWGEISPRRIWHHLHTAAADNIIHPAGLQKFLSELGWREFSSHLMFINPDMHENNLQSQFDSFPWQSNPDMLEKWKHGETGYPMVDAGMRELLTTGFMHNRLRMITASFLIKHLLIDWRQGEAWFWDRLVDADMGNNPAGWQWVAGCGADAAPFFRIFNPIIQGEKFDPDGRYIKRHVPELAGISGKPLYAPWTMKPAMIEQTGMCLGEDYPMPIVKHEDARERALAAFKSLSK